MRIISRLNIGGPAIHVQLLSRGLDPRRFESTIVTGQISPNEGDMGYLFDDLENKPIVIHDLQREISIGKDLKVFLNIFRLIRRFRPNIVHTHTAKAGSGARTTVFFYNLIGRRKILTVHTFHGHIFQGYFNRLKSYVFVLVERGIGRMTDVIIAISESQKNELTQKYRIAPPSKVKVIELGFDLDPFLTADRRRGQFRNRLGLSEETILIGIIGRLVPIKNHGMFLDAARILLDRYPGLPVKFLVVGDGELKGALKARSRRLGIEGQVIFCGWIREVAQVYADLNILALTSINEGTPVSIIEAMASSVPVIATKVGGVQDLMGAPDCVPGQEGFALCQRGVLCNRFDPTGFAEGIKFLIDVRSSTIDERVAHARSCVVDRYGRGRLISDIESLYLNLVRQAESRK
jgi:glycosyltransferase involved in cell wall biosynthesis